MNADRKKELKNAYRSRPVVGGVCCIRCSGSGRFWIQATRNMAGLRNRFDFARSTNSCPDPSMRDEWVKYGSGAFSFAVLEELKKGEAQTDAEFSEDLHVLHEIWLEKSRQGDWA